MLCNWCAESGNALRPAAAETGFFRRNCDERAGKALYPARGLGYPQTIPAFPVTRLGRPVGPARPPPSVSEYRTPMKSVPALAGVCLTAALALSLVNARADQQPTT